MDCVAQLRADLLPILKVWEQQLRTEYPDVISDICDFSVGRLTDWNGHSIGLECLFKEAAPDLPDTVALLVSLKHVHQEPILVSAEVVWGHGYIEASILPESIKFTPDHLAELLKRLPELFIAFKQAVQRGRPLS